jgi:hypothetical protein
MINFTLQFNVLEVVFATKPPGLGLNIINPFTHGIPANLFPTALGLIVPRKQDSIVEF